MLTMRCSVGQQLLQILNPSRNPSGEGFPFSFFLDAGGSRLFGTNERIKQKEIVVPTSAQGMAVDSLRVREGVYMPKSSWQSTVSKHSKLPCISFLLLWLNTPAKVTCGEKGLILAHSSRGYSPSWQGRNGNRSMRIAHCIMSADLEVEPS